MKHYIYHLIFWLVAASSYSQSSDQNYVEETIFNAPGSGFTFIGVPTSDIKTITYYDGHGRAIQQIRQNASPEEHKNIITHIEYEKNKGQTRSYLPYAADGKIVTGSGRGEIVTYRANFVSDAKNGTLSFYKTQKYNHTANPYSEQVTESSSRALPIETGAPGDEWGVGYPYLTGYEVSFDERNTIRYNHTYNTANEVRRFIAHTTWNTAREIDTTRLAQSGNYPAGSLQKTITKNENWKPENGKNNTTEEFTGSDGKVLLSRTYNNGVTHDTYYVYDFYGNLAYVLPPLTNGSITTTSLEKLSYQYRYDKKNRLVEKKQPGKAWEYMVYDRQDRLVLTQDGNLRGTDNTFSASGWMFTKYDAFDRIAYSGFVRDTRARQELQNAVNNTTGVQSESRTTAAATVGGTSLYYTNTRFPNTQLTVLNVNYYDTYPANMPSGNPTTVYSEAVLGDQASEARNTKGLLTSSAVRNIESNTWSRQYVLYDMKNRLVWSKKNNHLGGFTTISHKLNYRGIVLESTTNHRARATAQQINLVDAYTYDNQGRILKQTQKINSMPEQLIASYTYDALGALTTKGVGGLVSAPQPLQSVDYKYNIRGWLTDINNANPHNNTDPRKLFNYKIYYNEGAGYATDKVLRNGNINAVVSLTQTDNTFRGYAYSYDHLNRLNQAKNIYNATGGWMMGLRTDDTYGEKMTYDKNGNITSLQRSGETLPNGTVSELDDLSYVYDANRLLRVTDASGNTDGFRDGNTSGNDYTYDVNGNMKADKNKGITNITYNYLNLPSEIAFGNGNKIQYVYDAAGTRLQKKVMPAGGTVITTDFLDGFQYQNTVLGFFHHPEGYVMNQAGIYKYVFQYKDHLGNVRLSYTDTNGDGVIRTENEIVQENNYYPFGLEHKGYNDFGGTSGNFNAQKYKYNGQQWQDEFNLNVTAMDFRQYDNALGRFYSMDALSELTYDQTPYHFGFNNPVFWSDPTGLFAQYFQAVTFALSLDGNSTITYNGGLGGWLVTVEGGEFDGASFYDYEETGTIMDEMIIPASRGGGGGSSKKGFLNLMENGGMFTVWGAMTNMENTRPRPNRSVIDVSMNYDEVYERGAGSIRKGANFWKRLKDFLGGADSRSSTLSERFNKTESGDNIAIFKYKTFITGRPIYSDLPFEARPIMRDTFMMESQRGKTNWEALRIHDSIKAVEEAKKLNKQFNLN